jgi:prepilin-type N-terminal cleavage/methylation domain-containing protein
MKNLKTNRTRSKGFTLVELLVVVVIIAVLMGMLIPAVMRAKVRARIATARADMSNIKGSILSYQTDYSRFPVPRPLLLPSAPLPNWELQDDPAPGDGGGDMTFGAGGTPNYGVMRILCSVNDSTPYGSTLTVNGNFSRNPKKNKYLDVPSGDDVGDSGLDPKYNFNDPFGKQYIITMDMDGDGDCSDKYYRQASMNDDVIIGLRPSKWTPPTPPGGAVEDEHVLMGSVMIYSRGPDQRASGQDSALDGVNADNILDWR